MFKEQEMQNPDYNYLIKLDNWSKKDAALIISGLDPDQYRHIRFSFKELDFEKYPELVQPYRLHKIFMSINFSKYGHRQGDPVSYIVECKKKEWPVPEELFNLARERYAKEKELNPTQDRGEQPQDDEKKVKDYLLKTIGVLIMLQASNQKGSRLGDVKNVNVSQVVNEVLQFLEDHEIKLYGLGKSALNRRFSEGISAVEQSL